MQNHQQIGMIISSCSIHGNNLNCLQTLLATSNIIVPFPTISNSSPYQPYAPGTSNPSSNIAWAGGVASGLCWQEGGSEISSRCQRGVMSCQNRCALNVTKLQVSVNNLELFSITFTVDPQIFVGFLCFVVGFPPFPQKKIQRHVFAFSFSGGGKTSSHQVTLWFQGIFGHRKSSNFS